MIYTHFAMRLHNDDVHYFYLPYYVASWTLRARYGVLERFVVGSVSNPKPMPKEQVESIVGANGVADVSEIDGGIRFEAKTVTVILSGEAGHQSMPELEQAFSPYQGRLVDFTFDDIHDWGWFQYGRLTANFDYYNNRVTLQFFSVEPFRFWGECHSDAVTVRTNYEKKNNADAWVFDTSNGAASYASDTPGLFAYAFAPGDFKPHKRYKGVGAQPGAKMLVGIEYLQGGEVWFADNDSGKSKTVATVCPTSISGSTGELRMWFTVDGSYYEWQTVNGNRVYLPTIRCKYHLTNYVPIDGDGNIINYGDTINLAKLPSNVAIRPKIESDAGIFICDGVAVPVVDRTSFGVASIPRAVMPGERADKTKPEVDSVFAWIPSDNSEIANQYCTIEYYEQEVF